MNLGKPYRGRNSAEIFSAFTHRVHKAVQVGDKRKARLLQKLILKSTSARFLAIRQVSQLNAGKKTAGIDGKKSLSFEERFNLEDLLKMNSGNWKHRCDCYQRYVGNHKFGSNSTLAIEELREDGDS